MSPSLTFITPDFAVAPQLTPEQVRELPQHGIKSVVNNRPEHESPDQPPERALREAAVASQLEYHFLPVDSANITPQNVRDMAELLKRLPRPVLAFCRSGGRSARLYQAAVQVLQG